MTTLDMQEIDERHGLFIWGPALLVATLLLIVVLLGVRLWNKAGADIMAANAQERIAEAMENQAGRDSYVMLCKKWPPWGQPSWIAWLRKNGECLELRP